MGVCMLDLRCGWEELNLAPISAHYSAFFEGIEYGPSEILSKKRIVETFRVVVLPGAARLEVERFDFFISSQFLRRMATDSGPLSDPMYLGDPCWRMVCVITSRGLFLSCGQRASKKVLNNAFCNDQCKPRA